MFELSRSAEPGLLAAQRMILLEQKQVGKAGQVVASKTDKGHFLLPCRVAMARCTLHKGKCYVGAWECAHPERVPFADSHNQMGG